MKLSELLAHYLRVNVRIRSNRTATHYERSIRLFNEFLGYEATVRDLTDDNCAAYMLSIVRGGMTEATANQRIKQLKALWNWAAKKRLVEDFPSFANLVQPEPQPLAYSTDELRQLFHACKDRPGWIGPRPAGLWWLSQHWWYLDTGERPGATLDVAWSHVDTRARVARVPPAIRKGGRKAMTYRLSERTCDLLDELAKYPKPDERIWWQEVGYQMYLQRYAKLVDAAGIPRTRYKSGPYRMRVTVFSWIEAYGGNATAFARHSSRRVTEAYIDRALLFATQRGDWPKKDFDPERQPKKWFRLFG